MGAVKRELASLRSSVKTSATRPQVNQKSADTFNCVDRFNRLLGAVTFRPKCVDPLMRMLTGVISIAIVQSWVVFNDSIQQTDAQEDLHQLRDNFLVL